MVYGPGLQSLDAGIVREFGIAEKARFEARAEFFNALNHTNFGADGVITTVNDSRFGRVTSASEPRDVQFALKFLF